MSSDESNSEIDSRVSQYDEEREKHWRTRLGKRLAYILRYGASRDGLKVHEGGYVDVVDVLSLPMMRWYNEQHVLNAVESSHSYRGPKRFQAKAEHGRTYVRAVSGRRMEPTFFHEGTGVPKLLETCINYICKNIGDYALDDFPDEFLVNYIIHRLKRQRKLNNTALKSLLGPNMEYLDLEGVCLTQSSFRLICTRCTKLKFLNLKDCGYIVTDHLMEGLLKKLPELETLNLTSCSHITDRTLTALSKSCPELQNLNICNIQTFSEDKIISFTATKKNLSHLDMFNVRHISDSGKLELIRIAKANDVIVLLQGVDDPSVSPVDPCALLKRFRHN